LGNRGFDYVAADMSKMVRESKDKQTCYATMPWLLWIESFPKQRRAQLMNLTDLRSRIRRLEVLVAGLSKELSLWKESSLQEGLGMSASPYSLLAIFAPQKIQEFGESVGRPYPLLGLLLHALARLLGKVVNVVLGHQHLETTIEDR
jgi:hypothetical protein